MKIDDALNTITEQDFIFILKNGKRSSKINGHDFKSLINFSLRFVKETLPNLLKSGKFGKIIVEAFKDVGIGMFDCDVDRINNNEILYFILWLKDQLELWNLNELNYLSSEPNIELSGAGINELDKFGVMNVVDALAGGDITKHELIWKMKYGNVFDKQWKSVIESKIQKKLSKVKPKLK